MLRPTITLAGLLSLPTLATSKKGVWNASPVLVYYVLTKGAHEQAQPPSLTRSVCLRQHSRGKIFVHPQKIRGAGEGPEEEEAGDEFEDRDGGVDIQPPSTCANANLARLTKKIAIRDRDAVE